MNKSLLLFVLLGLIFPIIYTKGATSKKDITNAEETIDSIDFWDFNPNADSETKTVQTETISSKKSTTSNKSTMNELEQILKDMEQTLSKMGAPATERFLVQSSGLISSEEEILFPEQNTEFDLNNEEEGLIPDANTDTQDEEENQEDSFTDIDTEAGTETEEPETPVEEVTESNPTGTGTQEDEQTDSITAFESKNDQAGTATLSGSMEFDMNFRTFDQQNGKRTFINAITQALGVDSSLVRVTDIREGSVIFDFEITLPVGEENTLNNYATKLQNSVNDETFDAFRDVEILDFQYKVTVIAPVTPTTEVTAPKDNSLITVLVVVAGAIILAGIGFFVYKNKKAESGMKPMGKDGKYKRSASKNSEAERLDLESKGTGSRTAIGEEINDKLKLFAFSPPSDSSL